MRPRTRGPLDIISLLRASIQPGASTGRAGEPGVELGPVAEGPAEGPALDRQVQAGPVEVGAAPRPSRTGAVHDEVPDPHQAEHPVLVVAASAADACALGDHPTQPTAKLPAGPQPPHSVLTAGGRIVVASGRRARYPHQ